MTKGIVIKENEVATQSPVSFMNKAIAGGLDIDKIEKMLDLQAKYEAMEAKKAYTAAMAEFKAVPLLITKDKANNQYGSNYTTLGNLVNSALPAMSKSGLSHNWTIDQKAEIITVVCVVTHSMGHSESTSMSAPPDKSGSKNAIQQLKSTITYLKNVTFESAMGLASSDGNFDDDGNSSNIEFITPDQVKQIEKGIKEKSINVDEVLKFAGCETVDTITQKMFNPILSQIKATK